jgi:hypothetical protein
MIQPRSKKSAFSLVLLTILLLSSPVGQVAAAGKAAPPWQTPDDHGDTPEEATPIFVNQSVEGTIPANDPGDFDYFVLTTEVGRRYEVELVEAPLDVSYHFVFTRFNADEDFDDEDDTDNNDATATLEWTADTTTYYFRVKQSLIGNIDADYQISVTRFAEEPTPPDWDDCEINDSLTGSWSQTAPPGGPCPISVGATVNGLNFVPFAGQASPNLDFFLVSVKAGHNYRLETTVTAGVDTVVYLFAPGATDESQFIAANDDDPGPGLGSRIEWTPSADGAFLIKVENLEPLPHESSETYTLLVSDITPMPAPTATPGTPTATSPPFRIPGSPDIYEPNYDFGRATLIGLDTDYSGLNFVPWTGTEPDNDFYKLWVASGKLYTCETFGLGAATNTNMILCNGPGWEYCFAGNDDVLPFEPADPYRSRLTFFSSYNGYLYIILGQVGAEQILPEEWADLSYGLRCFIDQPSTATPTPTSPYVPPPPSTATPQPTRTPPPPATPTRSPIPTGDVTVVPSPTPRQLVVLPLTTPMPPAPATPVATPIPSLYVIDMSIYYDRNGNARMDPREGILDVLARAYDAISGDLLSIFYTDTNGIVRFTVPTQGPVRVRVPFFGFDQIVTSQNSSIQIRILPRP